MATDGLFFENQLLKSFPLKILGESLNLNKSDSKQEAIPNPIANITNIRKPQVKKELVHIVTSEQDESLFFIFVT